MCLIFLMGGCALYNKTEFSEYRGPSESQGQGGTVRKVSGIDVWETGTPDRRFKVLGVIRQSHYDNHSLMSMIANTSKDSDIIKQAKAHGGDAIIVLGSSSAISGFTTFSSAQASQSGTSYSGYGTANTVANTRTEKVIAVIKYLDEAEGPVTAVQPQAQGPGQPGARGTENTGSKLARLRRQAEAGDAKAQSDLAGYYFTGDGVARDYAVAAKWFRKAAEQGLAEAQYMFGWMCGTGIGIPKDSAEAVKWYRKAADMGHADAQYCLGVCYNNGDGVPQDATEAVRWYRKAAEQGKAEAQHNLGFCYGNGLGVPKDVLEAYRWWNLAAAQGLDAAKTARDQVEQQMTPEQVAEGQRLTREFQPKKSGAYTPGSP